MLRARCSFFLLTLLGLGPLGGCKPKPSPVTTSPSASAAAAASSAPAPEPRRAPSPRRTGSALARTVAGDALFVADEDHQALYRLGLPLDQGDITETKLPGPAGQVLVRDRQVWVTVREPGLLLGFAVEGKELRETARVKLPPDAWGMGLSPDESRMLVTSPWSRAVTLVEVASGRVIKTLEVAREPRAVVFAPDGKRAYVTHLVGTALSRIDLSDDGAEVRRVELPACTVRAPKGSTPGASLAYSAALSADGTRLFVPRHALGTFMPDKRLTNDAWIDNVWFGSAAIDVLLLGRDEPLAPKRGRGGGVDIADQAVSEPVAPAARPVPFVQPRDVALRSRTQTLLVVSEGLSTVTEHDALAIDPSLGKVRGYDVGTRYEEKPSARIPRSGAAPQGIALSEDENTAWLFARGSYEVVELALSKEPFASGPDAKPKYVRLGEDPLGAEASLGRRIFYGAEESFISENLACAGCHPEGRDDGFVWREIRSKPKGEDKSAAIFVGHPAALPDAEDSGRARQTPMLAGRIDAPGPYGWHGQNKDLSERVAEGFRLHRWRADGSKRAVMESYFINHLVGFLRKGGLRPPPRLGRALSEEEERGKALFSNEKVGCASCHPADGGYTNRASVPLKTPLPTRAGFSPDDDQAFKVPSLLFVGGTAPYYHDGSVETLEELVEKNGIRMGQTGHLSAEEKKALVAFLRTL